MIQKTVYGLKDCSMIQFINKLKPIQAFFCLCEFWKIMAFINFVCFVFVVKISRHRVIFFFFLSFTYLFERQSLVRGRGRERDLAAVAGARLIERQETVVYFLVSQMGIRGPRT